MTPIIGSTLLVAIFIGLYIYDRRTRPERNRRALIGQTRRRATTYWMGDDTARSHVAFRESGSTTYGMQCELCTHAWLQTAPNEAKELECPHCHHMNDLTTM